MDDHVFDELLEAHHALDPLARAVRRVVSFDLPDPVADRFHVLGEQMDLDAPADPLRRLTVSGGADRDWLIPFREAALGHVRSGLSAAYYHLEHIEALERAILAASAEHAPSGDPPTKNGLTMSPGDTSKLDFEYQAFRLALRRTLEYLGIAISRAFQIEDTRFPALDKAIAEAEPAAIREAVRGALAEARASLSDVLQRPTVRDRIVHEEPVQAGAINIHWYPGLVQVGLFGGGEELTVEVSVPTPTRGSDAHTVTLRQVLSPRLAGQANRTTEAVFVVFNALGLRG